MTKEEAYDKATMESYANEPNGTRQDVIKRAMDVWAKQEAIRFSIFKSEYRLIEGMNHRHDVTEKIGMITWRGASDETIWDAYKEGKQLLRWIENPKHPDNLLHKLKN